MNYLKFICILLIFTPTISVYFELQTAFCVDVDAVPGQKFHLYVESSSDSDQEQSIVLSIVNKHSTSIFSETIQHKNLELDASVDLNICFTNPSSGKRYVMFDIWTSQSNKIKQLASKSDVYELHQQMYFISQGLKNISREQKNQEQRQMLHANIILNYEGHIKWIGIVKILLIITLATGSLLFLRYTLSKDNGFQV